MSKSGAMALGVAALLAGPAASQTRTVYVPGVAVAKSITPPAYVYPQFRGLGLVSNLNVYNNTSVIAHARKVKAYGTDGPFQVFDVDHSVFPGHAESILTTDLPEPVIEFGQMELSDGLVATGSLVLWHSGFLDVACGPFPSPGDNGSASQGRIPLPVFEGLFPAGTIAVSGDVIPFNPGPPQEICDQEYRRRINVTLFNAGSQPTTFVVKARKGQDGGVVFSTTYQVPAETVRQFNSVYAPPHTQPFEDLFTSSLWFTITADQPFLSYISTTFDDPMPGAIQYEIFPSKLK